MKILWTVNVLMPKVAEKLGLKTNHAISWVDAMSREIAKIDNMSLAIVASADVMSLKVKEIDCIKYYILPKDCDKKDYWKEIIDDFNPDVIHVYGTENKHNKILIKNYNKYPIIISLQGIMTEYQRHYYAGIDFFTMLRYTSLQDLIVPTGFFSGRNLYKKRAINERELLKNVKYVEGRSTWDLVSSKNINPDLCYYYCPRMIREPFFKESWSVDKMERHSLFVSQFGAPLKGLHFVIEAISKLKEKYPDIKLYIAGYDRINAKKIRQKITCNGYIKYIKSLIKKYKVKENIFFTGILDAEKMAEKMASVNIVIVPSSIENAPNSLAEATIVGTPCIASFVGGNMDMLKHNEEGFLYCYNEPNMLAEYISRIFESDDLANKFSQESRKVYREKHNPQKLVNTLISIYEDVTQKGKNN